MRIGVMEILLILVLALVLFGGKKLSGVGKSLGQSIREFKKEISPDEKANDADSLKQANNADSLKQDKDV